MKVYLKGGQIVTKFDQIGRWIDESIRAFGQRGQREFWEFCFRISQKVWGALIRQTSFPPGRATDLHKMAHTFHPKQEELLPQKSCFQIISNSLKINFLLY